MKEFQQFTEEDLKQVYGLRAHPLMSLHMPVETSGPEKRKNWIQFKNLLQQAERVLTDSRRSEQDARAFLQPLYDRFGKSFWEAAGFSGFSLFYAEPLEEPWVFRLPDSVPTVMTLQAHAHASPLLKTFLHRAPFYLLCLTRDRLALFKGDSFGMDPLHDDSLPETLEEALGYEFEQKSLQFRTQAPPAGGGERAAIFHGHGTGGDVDDDQTRRFYQKVSGPLSSVMSRDVRPLILCGTTEAIAIYRKENSYPQVEEEVIERQPDSMEQTELRESAVECIRHHSVESLKEATAAYHAAEPALRAVDSIDTVLILAASGRVETAFIPERDPIWGKFDPNAQRIEHFENQKLGSEDLLDTIARTVHHNGGTVHFTMPSFLESQLETRNAAAVLRPLS